MRSSIASIRFGGAGLYFAAAGLLALLAGVSVYAVLHAAVPTAVVYVAGRDMPPGSLLTERDVTTRQMPAGALPDGAVTRKEALVGRRVRFGMSNGDVLRETHLITQAASEIPQKVSAMGEDYRAVMVPADQVPAYDRLIPGDRLELLAVIPIQDGPKGTNKVMPLGIATVLDTPQSRGSSEKGSVLVALRSEDVSRYTLATRSGNVVAVLQGSEPPAKLVPSLRLDELTGGTSAPTAAAPGGQAPANAAAQKGAPGR